MLKGWLVMTSIMISMCLIGDAVHACDTKTVFLPDGKVQICQVCEDAIVCY